jgi:biotin carboxyl carrier protein
MNAEREWEELTIDDTVYPTRLTEKYRHRTGGKLEDARVLRAAVPGKILSVGVAVGESVERGQGVLVLEAMKMENTILVGVEGVVKTVHVAPGALVAKGDLLVELERE